MRHNPSLVWYEITEFYVIHRSRGKGRTKKRAKTVTRTVWRSRHKDNIRHLRVV
jgi:hypothetical protein